MTTVSIRTYLNLCYVTKKMTYKTKMGKSFPFPPKQREYQEHQQTENKEEGISEGVGLSGTNMRPCPLEPVYRPGGPHLVNEGHALQRGSF